jgi:hypothetical protein
MTETFQCGDPGALVAYLYDECEPGEREQIAAHIKQCARCASEIDALGATRQSLAAWTPPDLALGFQITRADDVRAAANQPARVLTAKVSRWRAPMPAWAQLAAALLIFAAGLSVGVGSSGLAAPPQDTVSRDALAQVEQRLRAELNKTRPANRTAADAAPVAARASDEAVIQQVKELIAQSAAAERRDFTLRMVNLADALEQQRRVELSYYDQAFGQLQGASREQAQQRDAALYEALRRAVSQTQR